jgi:tetratricopeptide (TPR) repeat protein
MNRSIFLPLLVVAVSAALSSPALGQDKAAAPKPPALTKALVKPLSASQKASKEENWAECIAKAKEADAFPTKTAYDTFVVNEMLGFCAIRSGDNATAAKAFEAVLDSEFTDAARRATLLRLLMQINYSAKDYTKAIQFGQRAIQDGSANDEVRLLVAQSYYLQQDYKGTVGFLQGWVGETEKAGGVPGETALQLYLSGCIKLDDDPCKMQALEKQAQHHPKPETWSNLVILMLSGMPTDDATLQIYRLASTVGGMRRGEDYLEMAQIALDKGFPGEAQSALESAIAKKSFADPKTLETANRMLATAKAQSATDKASLGKTAQAAAANKNGQVDVRMGQAFLSYGQYAEAIAAIQRGIGKGNVRNPAEAQLALGQAQLKAGNAAEAVKSFQAVKGDATMERLGKLWAIHAGRAGAPAGTG